jgi:hypothetical protein
MRDKILISLLKKIDTDNLEGILPESRVEPYVTASFNMMSDYFTLKAVKEYITS